MIARLALPVTLLAATPAAACTLCHSDTAAQVREVLLGPDLLANALAVLAPLPLLGLLIWLLPRGR